MNSYNTLKPSLFILVLMISVGPFGDTIYAPSLPNISEALLTPYHNVQLTITFYLLGYSISQILYGPFSDRFGRKPVMILGALIFLFGSLICLFNFYHIIILIFGRFLQGFGACSGAIIATVSIKDTFTSTTEQSKIFAKINTAFVISPGVGAIVGTFCFWKTSFTILFFVSVFLLLMVLMYFPETLKKKNIYAIKPYKLITNYYNLFKYKGYFIYLCVLGLNIGIVYSCLIEAPAIIINVMKLSQNWFIIIAIGIVFSFMFGSIVCTVICQKIKQNYIILIGMFISFTGSSLLLIIVLINLINIYSILIPIIIIFIGIAFIIPIATAQALKPFSHTTGSASAMMGFFQMILASIITGVVAILPLQQIYSMPIAFIILSLLELLIFTLYLSLNKEKVKTKT